MVTEGKISSNMRINPKTVEELRSAINQKVVGEGRVIGGPQKGSKKALPSEFRFYKPNMTKTTDAKDFVSRGGVFQRQQQKGDLHLPMTLPRSS